MKIAYISDFIHCGYLPENVHDLRADVSWMKTLEMCHFPFLYAIRNIDKLEEYDFIIINHPKDENGYMLTYVSFLMSIFKKPKIGFIQHGGNDCFMNWCTEAQKTYIENIRNSDFFVITNKADKKYFQLLAPDTKIIYLPTDLDDSIVQQYINPNRTEQVMLSGNMVQWYGGTYSLLIAEKFGVPITIPSMGRRHNDELIHTKNIVQQPVKYVPYLSWMAWINVLSQHKYAVNMMPVAACGSFTVACAALGIPCIGREHITAQSVCFPDLCVNNNFDGIDEKIKYIKDNYDLISKKAREAFLKHFERNVVKKQFYDQLEKLK